MAKHIIFSAIAMIAITTNIFSLSVSAKEETEYWTVEDMMELKSKTESEIKEFCDGDLFCEQEQYFSRIDTDPKYYLLDIFNNSRIMVTALNPAKETIQLYYDDEDKMLSLMGIDERFPAIDGFYLLWLEDGANDPAIRTDYMFEYVEEIKNGIENPLVHVIFANSEKNNGENWLPPHKLVDFSAIPDSQLISNQNGTMYILVEGGGNMVGTIYYSTCLDSKNYHDGMDCRIVFEPESGYKYVPYNLETGEYFVYEDAEPISDEPIIELEKESSPDAVLEPIEEPSESSTTEDTDIEKSPVEPIIDSTVGLIDGILENEIKTIVSDKEILAPNTGAMMKRVNDLVKESFAWLVPLFTICSLPFCWLFWPKSRKSKKI